MLGSQPLSQYAAADMKEIRAYKEIIEFIKSFITAEAG